MLEILYFWFKNCGKYRNFIFFLEILENRLEILYLVGKLWKKILENLDFLEIWK